MDKEEILRIAREKYSIGTVVLSEYSKRKGYNHKYKIENQNFNWVGNDLKTKGELASPFIYYKGVWSEIISTPIKTYELW
jgi:hypothetical protein